LHLLLLLFIDGVHLLLPCGCASSFSSSQTACTCSSPAAVPPPSPPSQTVMEAVGVGVALLNGRQWRHLVLARRTAMSGASCGLADVRLGRGEEEEGRRRGGGVEGEKNDA
jgi:hypothetical protein